MNIRERALYPIDGNGKLTIEDIVNEASGGGDGESTTVDTLTGATTTGKALMKAASQEAARAAIGAGTSDFSGSYSDLSNKPAIPAAATVDNLGGAGETGKELMQADNSTAARAAIGAGTSNLALGTTATTALAGNTPIPDAATWANLSGKPDTFPPTVGTTAETAKAGNWTPTIAQVTGLQAALDAKATTAALADLAARVAALEAATEG